MKKAICTLSIGDEAEGFAQFSHPIFRQYATKINADFIVFRDSKVCFDKCDTINPCKFEKYQLYDVLEDYDRAAFFDTDILITPNAPDIFRTVSPIKIGGVFEDFGSELEDRHQIIRERPNPTGRCGMDHRFHEFGGFCGFAHPSGYFSHDLSVWCV